MAIEYFDIKKLARIIRSRTLPPPPTLKPSEWVEKCRRLPSDAAEAGPLRLDRTPYSREILDACIDPEVSDIVWVASAQVSKSETAISACLYFLAQDPSGVILVQPTGDASDGFSKERITPAIRLTEGLAELTDDGGRKSGSTIRYKSFSNGASLVLASAESGASLRSRPRRIAIGDEVSLWPESIGSDGDPVSLLRIRTKSFKSRAKHIWISTPTVKGECRITKFYEESDQRRFYVPCPHCQGMQILTWGQMKWPEGKPAEAYYACRLCDEPIQHHHKSWMLERGEWRATVVATSPGVRGYQISEMYSNFSTWGKMAQEFVTKLGQGPAVFQTFVNSSLGEVFDPAYGTEAKVDGLLARARASKYKSGIVPEDASILVAATDTQDDRLETLVQAVMPGGRIHTVQHIVYEGNLALPEVWDRLEALIRKPFKRADGKTQKIKKHTVDSGGHYTKEVGLFVKRRGVAGITVPIKGSSYPILGVCKQSKKRSKLWLVDTTAIKDSLYADLRVDAVGAPGHQSFPYDIEPDLFAQLMSERKVKTGNKRRYEVFPRGARNEMADLCTYCRAALRIYNPTGIELERFAQHYKDQPPIEVPEPEEIPLPLRPREYHEDIPVPETPEPVRRERKQRPTRIPRPGPRRDGPVGF